MPGAAIGVCVKTDVGEVSEPPVTPYRKAMGGTDVCSCSCWARKLRVSEIHPMLMGENGALESIYWNVCAGLEIVVSSQKRELGKFASFRKSRIVGKASDTVHTGPEADRKSVV